MLNCFYLSTNKSLSLPNSFWEIKAPDSRRDLVIKKISVVIIALLNFAVLGIALYYTIAYCPVPAQALLLSPFIVGVLAALTYLKFPTFGVSTMNYSQYLNPVALVGRVMAYVFFGPLMYAIDHLDWTPYHDPIHANKISKDLEKSSFEHIAELYGKHFNNLINYGFIHEDYKKDFIELYTKYKPIKEELVFWKNEGLEDCAESKKAEERLQKIEKKWVKLKSRFKYPFPHPDKPNYDFSKVSTRMQLRMRSYCCFGTPIQHISAFKA